MLFLHLSPLTRGLSSSLAEIGLLMCFLLWIASQYNAWGNVYPTYGHNSRSFKDVISRSEWVSVEYKKMSSNGDHVGGGATKSNNSFKGKMGMFTGNIQEAPSR